MVIHAEIWVAPTGWSMVPVKVDQPDKEIFVLSPEELNKNPVDIHEQKLNVHGVPVTFKTMQEVADAVWQQLEKERISKCYTNE